MTNLAFSVWAWNIANNYPPSVEIRGVSPLMMIEKCQGDFILPGSLGNLTVRSCVLAGAFNVSFSIISPHVGKYRINVTSFVASPSISSEPWSIEDLLKWILGRNATLARPEMWFFLASPVMAEPLEGNVPANGLEKNAVVRVNATIGRSLGYSGTTEVHLGTLSAVLTYTDIQAAKDIQRAFAVEVWTIRG